MYIRITTRCNMSCPHCCYNCTRDGEDMTMEVYRKALGLCKEYCDTPFLGGGEPTLHPEFEAILCEAIGTAAAIGDGIQAGVITNGSVKRRALLIAALAKGSLIFGQVSQDEYHDPISDEVIEAFQFRKDKWSAGIRDTTMGGRRDPLPHGRAKDLLDLDLEYEDHRKAGDCPCSEWVVEPNGDIRQCGCDDSPYIGDVFHGMPEEYRNHYCHKDHEHCEEYC